MKRIAQLFTFLLVVVLVLSISTASAFAESFYPVTPGVVYDLGNQHVLHIYDGVYQGTYYVPYNTVIGYGRENNSDYVIIGGKALEALDAKYDTANCGVGTPVGTFTKRMETATINFQEYCNDYRGYYYLSTDGIIGDNTWNAICYHLG